MIALTPSFLTSSLTFLLVNMQMSKHYFSLFSIWWPFCAEEVSNWFQVLSFGLLLLLLSLSLERSLGNNRANARGVREGGRGRAGGGGRPSCPYRCPPCKLAGSKPEYSHKQHRDRLDSTTPNWTGLKYTGFKGSAELNILKSWEDKNNLRMFWCVLFYKIKYSNNTKI